MQFSNIPTFVLFVCFHLLLSIKINKDIGEYRQLRLSLSNFDLLRCFEAWLLTSNAKRIFISTAIACLDALLYLFRL